MAAEFIHVGEEQYPLGQPIQNAGDYWEMYNRRNNNDAYAAAELIISRVTNVARAIGVDIGQTQKGFSTALYNPVIDEYTAVKVGELQRDYSGKDLIARHVEIETTQGSRIESEVQYAPSQDKLYTLTDPGFTMVTTQTYTFQLHDDYVRVYANEKDNIPAAPSLVQAVGTVLDIVQGNIVDPYEVIYGQMTEPELIREYLGADTVVDPMLKKVLVLKKPEYHSEHGQIRPAMEYDYDETIRHVKKQLREKIENSYGIIYQLAKQRHKSKQLK